MKFLVVAAVGLAAAAPAAQALNNLKTDWEAYVSPLVVPEVIDATKGGSFEFQIGRASHNWTADGKFKGDIYGYALKNATPTFPGPTIKVKKGVPISVRWHNKLKAPHLLDDAVESSLTTGESGCFPNCGIPVVVHVHGLESPAKYDGMPTHTVYENQSQLMYYLNNQSVSTKLYHDHAMGLTRLNVWSGLVGAYIIEDKEMDKKFNVDFEVDVPLMIGDRLISNKGELMYSDDSCLPAGTTMWVPESFGTVNLVNGVVMPYYEVPNAQVRLRWTNVANSRNYNFSIPFYDKCSIIARDSGYVQEVEPVPEFMNMYPFQRVEMVCDFSKEADGAKFELTDLETTDPDERYNPRIMEFRVKTKLKKPSMTYKEIPKNLVKLKDLKQLFKDLGGKMRTVFLGEMEYSLMCPSKGLMRYRNQEVNTSTPWATLACTRGKVEKWHFKNPTDDPHPFHWHLVNAQCGESDETIETNAMRDVVVIPNAPADANKVTQICYVACTPDEFLVEGATRGPTEYNFDTKDPYVAHCHILEHEENAMMSFFKLTDVDDDAPNDDGYVAGSEITSEVIWTAMGMSVLGGLAMCFSIVVISVERLHFLASHRSLSVAFSLAAGVMVFISMADLIPESIVYYNAHFTVGGAVDPEAYEYGGDTSGGGVCDKTCSGHAWLTMTAAFTGGVIIILIVEYIVHQWFKVKGANGHAHSHGEIPEDLQEGAEKRMSTHEIVQAIKSPTPGSPHHGDSVELGSPHTADSSLLGQNDQYRDEYKRAGIMTGIAMAIHNFPEGLALFVSSLRGLKTGLVLSIGIILHNIPEGVAVAAPVYYATGSKWEAFKWTLVSGIASPIGAAIGWAAVSGGLSYGLQGTLYAVVSGMLMCITAKELFPGAFRFDPSGKYFVSSFFAGMFLIAFGLILLHYAGSS